MPSNEKRKSPDGFGDPSNLDLARMEPSTNIEFPEVFRYDQLERLLARFDKFFNQREAFGLDHILCASHNVENYLRDGIALDPIQYDSLLGMFRKELKHRREFHAEIFEHVKKLDRTFEATQIGEKGENRPKPSS